MPVYNDSKHLPEAIESILAQTHRDFELVIINDGSTDASGEILKRYATQDSRITLIEHENWGASRSMTDALKQMTTDWVLRMDADDVMLPHRIERQIEFIRQHPGVQVVSCMAYSMNAVGQVFAPTMGNDVSTPEKFRALFAQGGPIMMLHPGVAFHRESVLSVGAYRDIWPCEDVDLWLRMAEQGYQFLLQKEILMKYRFHTGSITTVRWKETLRKLDWVVACSHARRQGQPELTYEAFTKLQQSQPWWRRVMRERRIHAQYLHKMAGFDLMNGQRLRGWLKYAVVNLLQPFVSLRTILNLGCTN